MAWASAVELTVKEITRAGVSADYTLVAPTATHGNKFLNSGREFLQVRNGSAAPITVTITSGVTVDDLALPTKVYTVAATGDGTGLDDQLFGPFPKTWEYTGGYVWAICSAVTTVTVGVFRLP
jgi:hypothetical protein